VISWVIGRGGLLGRSVEAALAARGALWHPREEFSWQDPETVDRDLTAGGRAFSAEVKGSPWQVAWCAGAGVVGSGPSDLEKETRAFARLLAVMRETLGGPEMGPGALFLASSAGGVYAGVGSPPYNEDSPVAPLAPYGWNKLEQESLARQWSKETGTPLLIGRLSNLYGPGQNISKNQGLISQVCLRVFARQPLILYVTLDTIRDYLVANDAGRLVADGLDRLRLEASKAESARCVTKILSSQQPATIASVLAQFRWITKRPASVILAASPDAHRQARDLRMTSSVWPDLDQHPVTTLSEGMRWVLTDILKMAGRQGIGINTFAS
jgi:UDP-glucose 4-epimerase